MVAQVSFKESVFPDKLLKLCLSLTLAHSGSLSLFLSSPSEELSESAVLQHAKELAIGVLHHVAQLDRVCCVCARAWICTYVPSFSLSLSLALSISISLSRARARSFSETLVS